MAQDTAFVELLKLCASNGGKNRYGDIKPIIDCFQENGFTITRSQLEYQLFLWKQEISIALNPFPPTINIDDGNNNETVINLTTDTRTNTNDNSLLTKHNSSPHCHLDDDHTTENNSSETNTREVGRTIKSTNKQKHCSTNLKIAITEASLFFIEAKAKAKTNKHKLSNGSFQKIIDNTKNKYELVAGSIKFETVKSRAHSNNGTGVSDQKISPLWKI
jgi:hypothetical protein